LAILPHPRWLGPTIEPSVRFDLDLGTGDEFTGSLGQAQCLGDDQSVKSDASHSPARHLLLGAVREVTPPILGQRAVPLASEHARVLEESIEHSRASERPEETPAIQA